MISKSIDRYAPESICRVYCVVRSNNGRISDVHIDSVMHDVSGKITLLTHDIVSVDVNRIVICKVCGVC